MRKDPEKYSTGCHRKHYCSHNELKHYTSYFGNRNGEYSHQFSSFDSFLEALGSTTLEEASKLYEQLLKEQVHIIITDYVCDKNPSMLLTTPHHK